MASERVVHCKKSKFDVYIGRPSIWGNPYSHKIGTAAQYMVATREDAIVRFEAYARGNPELLARLPELRHQILGCWCAPQSCHGEVLIKLLREFGHE